MRPLAQLHRKISTIKLQKSAKSITKKVPYSITTFPIFSLWSKFCIEALSGLVQDFFLEKLSKFQLEN